MKEKVRSFHISALLRAYMTHERGFMICSVLFYLFFIAALYGINYLASLLLLSAGLVAVTSNTVRLLFLSWQGYLILALAVILLPAVVCALMNAGFLFADDMLEKKGSSRSRLFLRGFTSIRLFFRPGGFRVIAYFMCIVPFGLMTILFYLPAPFELSGFVLYTLRKKMIFRIGYGVLVLLALFFLLRCLMLVHCVLIDGMHPRDALSWLKTNYRPRRRHLFRHILLFLFVNAGLLAAIYAGYALLPSVLKPLPVFIPHMVRRFLLLLFLYTAIGIFILSAAGLLPLMMTEITRLYLSCRDDAVVSVPMREGARRGEILRYLIPALLILTVFSTVNFNALYPAEVDMDVIVHRLGGFEEPENTMEGMLRSIDMEALSAETDVQRTADGHYVIFHDLSAARMCGVKKQIRKMTLEEVQALTIEGPGGKKMHVPTLEEVLDEAKGRMFLYIELKGPTADQQMADDVIAMVRERGMEEECALISMRYPTIKYVDENYSDIHTGLLYFFAYGRESLLEADMLIMQFNALSSVLTRSVHAHGKKILVWTVNTPKTARRTLRTDIDGIITDNYSLVCAVKEGMSRRNDYQRIMDRLGW